VRPDGAKSDATELRVRGRKLSTHTGIAPFGTQLLPKKIVPNGPKVALSRMVVANSLQPRSRHPGQVIEIDGKPVRVVGVLPKDFECLGFKLPISLSTAIDVAAQHTVNRGIGLAMWPLPAQTWSEC